MRCLHSKETLRNSSARSVPYHLLLEFLTDLQRTFGNKKFAYAEEKSQMMSQVLDMHKKDPPVTKATMPMNQNAELDLVFLNTQLSN